MYTSLLNMLHDAADKHILAIADSIHIDFDRIVQKTIQQHRRIIGDLYCLAHIALEIGLLMHDFHGATAQHIAGAHYQRIANLRSAAQGLLWIARRAIRRLL